ncbi:MAG: class I SAM-dependent methyltransferase, partial [Hymenobacter sp.]
MPDIYNDATYLTQNPTWHEEDAPFKTERILRLLRRNQVSLGTVCEVGCGSGEILVQLARQLPGSTRLVGYDISQQAMAIAQPKATEQLQFVLQDFTSPSVTDKFDLLLVIDVLEHLDNYFEFLRGIVGKARYTMFHIP